MTVPVTDHCSSFQHVWEITSVTHEARVADKAPGLGLPDDILVAYYVHARLQCRRCGADAYTVGEHAGEYWK